MGVTIVGLGPGAAGTLTSDTVKRMKSAACLYLRTEQHPTVKWLKAEGIRYMSFDRVYDEENDFDRVYSKIVETIIEKALTKNVVYAVPGSPFVAERTVDMLIKRCKDAGISCDVLPAVSFVDAVLAALRLYPGQGIDVIDALDLICPDVKKGCLVVQVYNPMVASKVKLHLMEFYPDDYNVTLVKAAGCDNEIVRGIRLFELDRQKDIDHLTSVYVPPALKTEKSGYRMEDLESIMAELRGGNGCPWDLKQTHESLKPYLIEEAYEVLETIDEGNMDGLCDELGDVLLQVVFHSQIAREKGFFTLADVITNICRKMVRRHPHIFGITKADTAQEVVLNWEQIKRNEKGLSTYTSTLQDVPKGMPALIRAYKIQQKASLVGFDWDEVKDAFVKLEEEVQELKEVYNSAERDKIKEELGDVLFAAVNVARFLKIQPELALGDTIGKFIHRFEYIEQNAPKNLKEMSLAEMDRLWNLSKSMKKPKKNNKNRYN
jgi:tetrapyrrole methylase family protein/MazG family protein